MIPILLCLCLFLTGCGKEAKLEDNSTILTLNDGEIKADALYNELKERYGINILIDLLDHQILDEKYPTTEEETTSIDSQISMMKSQYNNDEDTFLAAIQQYLGVRDEDELRDMLSLEFKRNEAVEDYIKDHISDDEVNEYYNNEIVGDMQVRHILIKPDTNQDMSQEEQDAAEQAAKEKAEDLIRQLDEGADFQELAKEYSDDTGSASDGGFIDYFNKDSNMDEAFYEASKNLEVGKYTEEPVKSTYGYHIILKEDQKDKPTLEDVKESILEDLMQEKMDNDSTLYYQTLINVRADAGLEFQDDGLKQQYDDLMNRLIENARNSSAS